MYIAFSIRVYIYICTYAHIIMYYNCTCVYYVLYIIYIYNSITQSDKPLAQHVGILVFPQVLT